MRRRTHFPELFVTMLAILAGVAMLPGCHRGVEEDLREAVTRNNEAREQFENRRFVESLDKVHQAITLYEEAGAESSLAGALALAARNERQLGQYSEALGDFRRALDYSKQSSNQKLERDCRLALAELSIDLQDYRSAAELASSAAASAHVFADSADLLRAYLLTAHAELYGGNYDNSIVLAGRVLRASIKSGKEENEAYRLLMLNYAASQNDSMLRQMIPRWRNAEISSRDSGGMVLLQRTLAEYQIQHDRPDSALRSLAQALTFLSPRAGAAVKSGLLTELGSVAYRLRQFDNARRHFIDALEVSHGAGNLVHEQLLKAIIVACDARGDSQKRIDVAGELRARITRVISICRALGFTRGEAFASFINGVLLERSGNTDASVSSYLRALELHEQIPAPAIREYDSYRNLTDAFMAGEETGWYEAPMRLAGASADPSILLEIAEARNLGDLAAFFRRLAVDEVNPRITGDIRDVQWKIRALGLLNHDLESELGEGRYQTDSGRCAMLHSLVGQRLSALDTAAGELKGISANYGRLIAPRRVRIGELRSALTTRQALIEFVSGPGTLYAIIVRRDTVVVRKTIVRQAALQAAVDEYLSLFGFSRFPGRTAILDDPAALSRSNRLSSYLYEVVITPSLTSLKDISKLYVVVPPEFRWLPLHTLQGAGSGGQFENEERLQTRQPPLITRFNVSYLPSGAMLLFSAPAERSIRTVVGLGHPGSTGWDVEYELKDIRSFYDKAEMLFDISATVEHLQQAEYDVLHIAAEVHLDASVPARTNILLASSVNPLGMEKVPIGKLGVVHPPQAMIISNVSTKPGELFRYVPALILAHGTSTLIGSMWQGDRKAKKYFGEMWYTNLMAGIPASDAYAAAMVAMTKKGEFSRPNRWGLYYQYGK